MTVRDEEQAARLLLTNEVLPPDVEQVGLQGSAGRAIVVKTRDTTIDLETRGVEHAPPQHRIEGELVQGLALQIGGVGSHLGQILLPLLYLRSRALGGGCECAIGIVGSQKR